MIRYALLGIGLVLIIIFYAGIANEDAAVNMMLRWAYVLFFVAIGTAVVMPLFNLAKNPAGAMRSLIGLGVVAVVLIISYAMSSDTAIQGSGGLVFDNPAVLKLTDTGLYAAYFAMAAAILAIVAGEIRNVFK